MSEALRFNEGKPKLSYFMRSFPWMTAAVARVKECGANKYEEDNWRAGNKPDTEYLDSMYRHMDYFFSGEFYDQDSGCSHLAHAVWNLSALCELNYKDEPIIDEELFAERMAHWAQVKADRKEREQEREPEYNKYGDLLCPRCHSEVVEQEWIDGETFMECECGEVFDVPDGWVNPQGVDKVMEEKETDTLGKVIETMPTFIEFFTKLAREVQDKMEGKKR